MAIATVKLIVFFLIGTYCRCGEVAITKILGVPIYRRVGYIKELFGFAWDSEKASPLSRGENEL